MMTVSPIYNNDAVTVVFSSDDNFLPCTAVSMQSIVRHASPERYYDLILLHSGIADERLARLCGLADDRENVSIRCFNASSCLQGNKFYTENRWDFNDATFYRLCIPWLFQGYDKVLYLDGDTLAMTDVAQLADTDIRGCLLGAALDICGQGNYFNSDGVEASYRRKLLKMDDPENYFNSGVLLINIIEFRERFTQEFILEKTASYDWKGHDQDVLNSICAGSVKWLDFRWNFIETIWNSTYLPERYRRMLEEARQAPLLYHYASEYKPWSMELPDAHLRFWDTAATTPFYGELQNSPKRFAYFSNTHSVLDLAYHKYIDGEAGMRYLLFLLKGWASFKLKRWRRDEM